MLYPLQAATRIAWPSLDRRLAVLSVFVLPAAVLFSWLLVAQHRSLNSRAYDLGYFDQVIWNTAHGRWFETTFVEFNFLGEHFSPVLLLFAGLYRLGGSIETVLVLQAVAVALAAVPLALATWRLLGSAAAGVLVAAAYLLSPYVHAALLFDFHPELFGVPALFGALALLAYGRPGAALAAVSVPFVLKEDAALVGLGMAVVFWVMGYRRQALLLAAGSLLYLAVIVGVVMPAIRGPEAGLMARYGYLGGSLSELVAGLVLHPDRWLLHLAGAGPRGGALALLFACALLPLWRLAVVIAAPMLAMNLLSTHPPQASLSGHYGAYPIALCLVAAVLAAGPLARRLAAWWPRLGTRAAVVIMAALLAAQALSWLIWSPLGGRLEPEKYQVTAHTRAAAEVFARIPPEAPLSAQSNLLPHLSRRAWVRDFPRLDGVEYVVVDFKSWGMWQTTWEIYRDELESLEAYGFCHVFELDGFHLYRMQRTCAVEGAGPAVAGDGHRSWGER